MLVLHANWSGKRLHIWAESESALMDIVRNSSANVEESCVIAQSDASHNTKTDTLQPIAAAQLHTFSLDTDDLHSLLIDRIGLSDDLIESTNGKAQYEKGVDRALCLRLPLSQLGLPMPSPRLAGLISTDEDDDQTISEQWASVHVPSITLKPEHVLAVLCALDEAIESNELSIGASLRFWTVTAQFVAALLVSQRFLPSVSHHSGYGLHGSWRLWLHDDDHRRRLSILLQNMPPVTRSLAPSGDISPDLDPWSILDEMISVTTDATVRRMLGEQELDDALTWWKHDRDVHIALLEGWLRKDDVISLPGSIHDAEIIGKIRDWFTRLTDTGENQPFRLCLKLLEPTSLNEVQELFAPSDSVRWRLVLSLVSTQDPEVQIDATKIWSLKGDVHFIEGIQLDHPQDVLLREIARGSKIYDHLETALGDAHPSEMSLTTLQAHSFMRDYSALLEESGFTILIPDWWASPESRLSARLQVESDDINLDDEGDPDSKSAFGLDTVVACHWRIALGERALTPDEFEWLARQISPLVRIRGQWVEVRPGDIATAKRALEQMEGGSLTVRDALRLAYGEESKQAAGLPVMGMDATGWVGELFATTDSEDHSSFDGLHIVPQPTDFVGTLRPYQVRGLSWLVLLDRLGLGGCLADDMGLGKTIQIIALLLWERERAARRSGLVGPTLLIVPTSVVSNWVREIHKFAPELRVLIHHGSDRRLGEDLEEQSLAHDVVVTTYALSFRDHDDLAKIRWWRVCLDEAQNIKNPQAKQTQAIQRLQTARRVTLTGTPVENRLSELWSIMEFCNPGFLGTSNEFRRGFAIPVERYNDRAALTRLRGFIQPFILRRLKTDPRVIADLPDKLEHKVYCDLTTEQTSLYEHAVSSMLSQTDAAEGIKRRGLVLAMLVKLKQICNHPTHYLKKEGAASNWATDDSARSGKTARLISMLEEVVAEGDSALVFTQFREMGHLLQNMLRHDLGIGTIFLHGGTPALKRTQLVDQFQERDGTTPIFILSLKAGGIGLNLTAANHVFHFDRWWNPAIENQATDRAFRIGQTRTVQVHKFICSGTLEERIDEMLESKTELAENVVGSGEKWLTEMSTENLKEMLTLRYDE